MQLTRREKQGLVAAAVLVAAFVGYQTAVRPAMARARTLERVLKRNLAECDLLRAKGAAYIALKAELAALRGAVARAREDFGVMAHLEAVQKECGIASRVAHMKPETVVINDTYVEKLVDIKLARVTMAQVIRFLQRLQNSEVPLAVKSFDVKRASKSGALLDVSIQVGLLALADSG